VPGTEHSSSPIRDWRNAQMILADDEGRRKAALAEARAIQKQTSSAILRGDWTGLPVTISARTPHCTNSCQGR